MIGGVAGNVRGSSYPTYDLDIAYAREDANLERLAQALRSVGAKLRGAPADVPFLLDAATLKAGSHFTFATDHGGLDILSDPQGVPRYAQLKADAEAFEVRGLTVRVASLDHLIAMKEASGRTKDKLMATEYRVISDLMRAPKDEPS